MQSQFRTQLSLLSLNCWPSRFRVRIYTGVDLYVGYDHRTIHPDSRDLLAFDTPFGTVRLTKLPQSWYAAVSIFHGDAVFILQFATDVAPISMDDIFIHGKATRYELKGGGWKVLEDNPNIRVFVFEHFEDINRILHRLKHAGATISVKKFQMGVPELKALGQTVTYGGRKLDTGRVVKLQSWLPCESASEVRGFLGTMGTVHLDLRVCRDSSEPAFYLVCVVCNKSPSIKPIYHCPLTSLEGAPLTQGYLNGKDQGPIAHCKEQGIADVCPHEPYQPDTCGEGVEKIGELLQENHKRMDVKGWAGTYRRSDISYRLLSVDQHRLNHMERFTHAFQEHEGQ